MAQDDSLTAGTVLNERYRVEELLGAGGYSDVVAAFDLEEERPVALKVLHEQATVTDPRAVARLRQEAEILRAIDHPHIVDIYDVDSFEGGQFLVMEYVDGTGLDELLEAEAPFETRRLLPMMRQLLDALDAAHATEILHRDLKPENILVVDADDGEFIKLVDFGVAKANSLLNTDDPDKGITLVKTQAGNFVGTPRYAAPEMVVGDPLSAASDLFGVAVVAYEALTATPLICGQSQSEVMNQLVFPRPFDLSDIPEPWPQWLAPMLEKSPDHRISSAAKARQLLDEVFSTSTETADERRDSEVEDHPLISEAISADQLEPTTEVESPLLVDEVSAAVLEEHSSSVPAPEDDVGDEPDRQLHPEFEPLASQDAKEPVLDDSASPPSEGPSASDSTTRINTILTFLILALLAFILGTLFLGLR